MDRVLCTLAGKPVDRRPVAPVLGLYGARLTGSPLEQYYTDPAAYARGQAAVREVFHPDLLFAPLAFAYFGAAFGSQTYIPEGNAPALRRPVVHRAGEWADLPVPDPQTDPGLSFFLESIRRMTAEHRGEVPVAMVLPIPADIPCLVMGMEGWMDTVLFDPAGAQRIMEKVIPFYLNFVDALWAAGVTLIAMPCGFASPALVTRAMVENFTRPLLSNVLARIEGPVFLHNVGSPLLSHLDLLTGLPSVAGFVLDETDDFEAARRIAGPSSVLVSGFDCTRLCGMTLGEVERMCRKRIEERRDDPCFILGTSGPDIPLHTPPENIHALRRMAEEYAGEQR